MRISWLSRLVDSQWALGVLYVRTYDTDRILLLMIRCPCETMLDSSAMKDGPRSFEYDSLSLTSVAVYATVSQTKHGHNPQP